MTIIMNEIMQGDSKFSRMLNITVPRMINNPDNEEEMGTADWHRYVKIITQEKLQSEDKTIVPKAFCLEDDEGILPYIYQGLCITLTQSSSKSNYNMNLPYYDEQTMQETPVIKEITDNLLKDGIYLPFLVFIDLEDYRSVVEAAKTEQDVYTILISELVSKARGENLTDFYVVSMNLSELISRLEFKEEDFDNAESLRVVYPMLMSAVAGEISSPYPEDIFQSSAYFQNLPVGDEDVPEVDE